MRRAGWLEAFQDSDGAGGGVPGDPGGPDAAGDGFALERQAGDLPPVDGASAVLRGRHTAAGQMLDYWREGVILTVRYSPSAVTSPPAVDGRVGLHHGGHDWLHPG